MASNGNNRSLFLWVGGAAFLILAGVAFLPKIMGKAKAVAPGGAPAAAAAPAIAAALGKPGFADYGVANSLYGHIPRHNFAGMAVEMPSPSLPLGFHLSNVF